MKTGATFQSLMHRT